MGIDRQDSNQSDRQIDWVVLCRLQYLLDCKVKVGHSPTVLGPCVCV